MPSAPALMTSRLSLRGLVDGDAPFIASLITNYLVRRYLGGVTAPDEIDAKVGAYINGGPEGDTWLVMDRTGPAYGMVFLGRDQTGALALSYQFHPDAWGRGLAQESCRAVLGYAQTAQLDDRIVAETQLANTKSRALLEALGFVDTSRYKKFGARQVLYAVDLPKWAP